MLCMQAQQAPDLTRSSSPDILHRVLDSCNALLQSPHQLMLLTMHAVLLETGMQLTHQVLLTWFKCMQSNTAGFSQTHSAVTSMY